MDHYACAGTCGGANKEHNTCGAEGCTHKGKPMEPCSCNEDKHLSQFADREHKDTNES